MKQFFQRYSYNSVQLLLNQVAISMFGFALAMTAVKAENDTLLWITSAASILFYLILCYGTAWRVGSADRTGIEHGKRPFRPLTGLWIALVANSLNLLLALLITIGTLGNVPSLASISRTIALLIQGMYQGLLAAINLQGAAINQLWWPYFLITIPVLVVALVGYIAGAKDVHITGMGIPDMPASDRPTRREMKEKQKQDRANKK